jgi:hypothetical protein
MTYARKSLVSLDDTPYYHVVARCVRRAWLWGYDQYAGRDYSHRKSWILERLAFLTSMFAIDVAAYAVMSNHYHLVLHVDRSRALKWTQEKVVAQWTRLFGTPRLVERWLKREGQRSGAAEGREYHRAMARTFVQHQLVYALYERASCSQGERRRQLYRPLLGGALQVASAAR